MGRQNWLFNHKKPISTPQEVENLKSINDTIVRVRAHSKGVLETKPAHSHRGLRDFSAELWSFKHFYYEPESPQWQHKKIIKHKKNTKIIN